MEGGASRLKVLKEEATKMIETLAEYENIYLSISPFSATANSEVGDNINEMLNLKSNKDIFISANNSIINRLIAKGGTNTGDGMRRGFSSIVNFNNEIQNEDKTTKNFMIILVDGDTTFATITERVNIVYKETNSNKNHKGSITLNIGTPNERIYNHVKTEKNSFWWWVDYTHYYRCDGDNHTTNYTELDKNVGDYSGTDYISGNPYYGLKENDYKPDGKVIGNGETLDDYGKEYVSTIGKMIREYRNTRDDGIETFIVGFSNDTSLKGLQQIADATQSKYGPYGSNYKYYKADTAEALQTVLDEIKFQISEALWHIGGPN